MTKNELIVHIAEETGAARPLVTSVLEELAKVTESELAIAGEISLPGIGKLQTVNRPARSGRNPRTGEYVSIAPSVGVKFKTAKSLKDALN